MSLDLIAIGGGDDFASRWFSGTARETDGAREGGGGVNSGDSSCLSTVRMADGGGGGGACPRAPGRRGAVRCCEDDSAFVEGGAAGACEAGGLRDDGVDPFSDCSTVGPAVSIRAAANDPGAVAAWTSPVGKRSAAGRCRAGDWRGEGWTPAAPCAGLAPLSTATGRT